MQGLIPIKDLSLKQPSLNETKIKELNAYIDTNKPDIVILNETWLKNSIANREIISNDLYIVTTYLEMIGLELLTLKIIVIQINIRGMVVEF